jgi:hypothetical protein
VAADKKPETHYRGEPIRGHALRAGGTLPVGSIVNIENLDIHDHGQALITFTVKDMGHSYDDKLMGIVRKPKLTITEMHLLGEHEGDQLLVEMRERDEKLLDIMLGRRALPFDGTDPGTGEIPDDGEGGE